MNQKELLVVSFAIIDTNVLVSSMLGNKPSSTKDVVNFITTGNIIPLYDQRILDEYYTVLSRYFTDDIVRDKLSIFFENGYLVSDIEETKVFFSDRSDIPFFEVKESAKELDPYLITGNTKHYPVDSTRTPAFVVDVMKYLNGFVVIDKERYLNTLDALLESLDKDKYIKGGGTIPVSDERADIDTR